MPAWKVLFIVLFGFVCLALALGTIVVPISMGADDSKWAWFAGLLVGTIVMGTLFTMFLRHADRTFKR
jgi:hypothetical protein